MSSPPPRARATAARSAAGAPASTQATRHPRHPNKDIPTRAFAQVSGDILDQVLGAWLWTRAARIGGRMVIAVDGKAVRGAKGKDGKAPHLVAALAHGIGAVLGQVAADARSNEIPAVRELLTAFGDLAGAVLTMDALHAQHDTAQAVPGLGALVCEGGR
ncbi:MAG TPA: ISAs1 family transposase [Trebonia sp.]